MAQPSLPTSDSIAYPSECPMKKTAANIPHTGVVMSHKIVIPHPRLFSSGKKPSTPTNLVSEGVTEMKVMQPQHPSTVGSNTMEMMKSTKLCDLIKTEELFPRHGVSEDELYELEPHRSGMLSVRRRSTQFYTLVEEEEDREGKVAVSSTVTETTIQEDSDRMPGGKPVFNMAESIRKLYYPGDTWKQKGHKHAPRLPEEHGASTQDVDADTVDSGSVPQAKPLLRRIQSHPELTSYQGWQSDFDVDKSDLTVDNEYNSSKQDSESQSMAEYSFSTSTFSKSSRSVPQTPVVSPKTLRKSMQSDSFMSRVAGALHVSSKYKKKYNSDMVASQNPTVTSGEQQLVARTSRSIVSQEGQKQELALRQEQLNREIVSSRDKLKIRKPQYLSDGNSTDDDDSNKKSPRIKKSAVSGIINWGTKSKVTVTKKEQNAFSPTSF